MVPTRTMNIPELQIALWNLPEHQEALEDLPEHQEVIWRIPHTTLSSNRYFHNYKIEKLKLNLEAMLISVSCVCHVSPLCCYMTSPFSHLPHNGSSE